MTETQPTERFSPEENQIIKLLDADRNYKEVRTGWRDYHRSTESLLHAAEKRSIAILETLKETHLGNLTTVEIHVDGTFNRLKIIIPSIDGSEYSKPSVIKTNVGLLETIDSNVRTYLPKVK